MTYAKAEPIPPRFYQRLLNRANVKTAKAVEQATKADVYKKKGGAIRISEQRVLKVIADQDLTAMDLACSELMEPYAHELAAISHKINRDELATLVVVGVALYQKGLKEFRVGINEKTLFAVLQKRTDEGGA